jgi:hypothetical protein
MKKKRYSDADIEKAVKRDDPDELLHLVVSVALNHEGFNFIFNLCLKLSHHNHPNVRGNAILGFGHLARRFGRLDMECVKPLIEAALKDDDFAVSGQAWAAASDVEQFLGWKVDGLHKDQD